MEKMDEKLSRVLNYVRGYIEENGFPPTVREICSELGIKSTATAYSYLERLKEQGQLKKSKAKNRAIEVLDKNKVNYKTVPLIGRVTAGMPILAQENVEGYFPLPSDIFRSNDLFMLAVEGESMIEAGICDGDIIIVNRQNYAENGDIVVALIDSEATVKRFYREKDYFRLHPENSAMSDIIIKDCMVLGKVCGLLRKY